jgi:hypothetical protein
VRAPNIAEILGTIAKALKSIGVRWYVFGAQAVVAAGYVRQTADIDITTDDVPVDRLRAALHRAGFELRKDIAELEDLIEHHRIVPLRHRSGLNLDVVRAGPGLELEMLGRAIQRRVGRRRIPFVETNDLIVLKMLAARAKDLEDVRGLLRTGSPEINVALVRSRLEQLGGLIDDSTLVESFERELSTVKRGR